MFQSVSPTTLSISGTRSSSLSIVPSFPPTTTLSPLAGCTKRCHLGRTACTTARNATVTSLFVIRPPFFLMDPASLSCGIPPSATNPSSPNRSTSTSGYVGDVVKNLSCLYVTCEVLVHFVSPRSFLIPNTIILMYVCRYVSQRPNGIGLSCLK